MLVNAVLVASSLVSIALEYESPQSLALIFVVCAVGLTQSVYVRWMFFCGVSVFIFVSATEHTLVQHMLVCLLLSVASPVVK